MEAQTADQRSCAQSLCRATHPAGKGLCSCCAVYSTLWQRELGCKGLPGSAHPWATENWQRVGSVGCSSGGEAVCSSAGPDVSTGLLQNRATGLYSQGGYLPRVWVLLAQKMLMTLSGGNRGDGQSLVSAKASYACKRTNFVMPSSFLSPPSLHARDGG